MTFRWKFGRSSHTDPQGLRCSFCNKGEAEVRKLIAGPTVFICDECVGVCNDILSDDGGSFRHENGPVEPPPVSSPPSTGRVLACTLCGLPMSWEDAVLIPERGALCAGCTGEVEAAIAEKRERPQ
jgi:hypothetical protein